MKNYAPSMDGVGKKEMPSPPPSPSPQESSSPTPSLIEEWRKVILEAEAVRKKILSLKQDEAKISEILKAKEVEMKKEIISAVDEEGKKIYKNETEREVALSRKMREDIDYVGLKDELKDTKKKKEEMLIRLETLKDWMEFYKTILEVIKCQER